MRLFLGVGLGLLAGWLVPDDWLLITRLLIGWSVVCLFVLGSIWPTLLRATPERTRALSEREDDSRTLALALTVAAALVSLPGVGFALYVAQSDPAWQPGLTALAVLTTALSWLLLHTEYTLHYARLYYQDGGGLVFLDGEETVEHPDYGDFLYMGLTIGMTYQVSDTETNSRRMRRLLLQHAALSYLFGSVVVALTVSGVASLLS